MSWARDKPYSDSNGECVLINGRCFTCFPNAKAPRLVDATVTCPSCGNGKAFMGQPTIDNDGFNETCCRCEYKFVDFNLPYYQF